MNISDRYLDGTYADSNPEFGDDSCDWKVASTMKALEKWDLSYKKLAEVGCGGGSIIAKLSELPEVEQAIGFEPMPEAFAKAKKRETEKLRFLNEPVTEQTTHRFDLALCYDVFEHVEDPFAFLRSLKGISKKFLFHIPLDMNAQMVFRGNPVMATRESVGHLHYFSKDTALATLKDSGLKVEGWFYTCGADAGSHDSALYNLAKVPRKVFFGLNEDFTVRVLGGYSLLVLAGC